MENRTDGRLADVPAELDTLIIPGGAGSRRATADEELIEWISRSGSRARRIASVCTGAFLLARAGLLDGRRATTHWASAEELARSRAMPRFVQTVASSGESTAATRNALTASATRWPFRSQRPHRVAAREGVCVASKLASSGLENAHCRMASSAVPASGSRSAPAVIAKPQ